MVDIEKLNHYLQERTVEAEYEDPAGTPVFYQKEGFNAGCSAYLRVYSESDTTVVILSNMAKGVWEPIWFIHEQLMAFI